MELLKIAGVLLLTVGQLYLYLMVTIGLVGAALYLALRLLSLFFKLVW